MMPPNPFLLADKAQQMAKKAEGADCQMFQKVALVSMVVMAAAGATQLMLQVIRELRRDPDRDHCKGR